MVGRSMFAGGQFTFSETRDGLLTIEIAESVSNRSMLLDDLTVAFQPHPPRTHSLTALRARYPEFGAPLLALVDQIDWRPVSEVTFSEGTLSARLPPRDEP